MRHKIYSYKKLKDEDFRRRTGVKRPTFLMMANILDDARKRERAHAQGKKNSLSIEQSLLMGLEYLREYRTYFHISTSYRVSESTCWRTCRWVEDTLIADPRFHLKGKKALVDSLQRDEDDFIVMDVAESPVERPKKREGTLKTEKIARRDIILEKRNVTRSKRKSS